MARNDRNNCIDPSIYPLVAGSSLEETRLIWISKYIENELDIEHSGKLEQHLSLCSGCAGFRDDLKADEPVHELPQQIVHASCPSSAYLDAFVFSRETLSAAEQRKIEQHLTECPLCADETRWVAEVAGEKWKVESEWKVESGKSKASWWQYASIAAALFFMALSAFLITDRIAVRNAESKLRSVATVKGPEQLNFEDLRSTSVVLPQKMNGIYEQGVKALRGGRFQEAIRHFEIVATAHPEDSASLFLLGYSYFHMNEGQRAFELCDRAEKMGPHSLERCLTLVNIALKTGHYQRALEEISGLNHEAPNHPEIKETYERIKAASAGGTFKL